MNKKGGVRWSGALVALILVGLLFGVSAFAETDRNLAVSAIGTSNGVEFRVRDQGIESFQVSVFTSNGKPLFKSGSVNSNSVTWNLTDSSGNKVPVGVYLYQFVGKSSSGEPATKGVAKIFVGPGQVYGEAISTGSGSQTTLSAGAKNQGGPDSSPERYVVVFQGKKVPKKAAQIVKEAGGELIDSLEPIGVGIATSSKPDFADNLRGARGIQSVGAEGYHKLPPVEVKKFSETEAEEPTEADLGYELYQWDIRRVKADQAWNEGVTGSDDTVVAILDTGIAYNHPDLEDNVVHNACYRAYASCPDQDDNPAYPRYSYHGTHTAGIVAAAFDGGAAVGVGPNLGLANYNIFELYEGYGLVAFDTAIWQAMLNVAEQGYDVINMSLGGSIYKPESQAAAATGWKRVADYVSRQGVTIVASSGNGDLDLNGSMDNIPSDVPGIISVGATGIRPEPAYPQEGAYDVRAFYSNYGASVSMVAPGGDCGLADSCNPTERPVNWYEYLVFSDSVEPNATCAATASCSVGYTWAAGTSMSAPHVSGAAGLVKDSSPHLKSKQIISILKRTAEKLGDRQKFGHGMVDVLEAIEE